MCAYHSPMLLINIIDTWPMLLLTDSIEKTIWVHCDPHQWNDTIPDGLKMKLLFCRQWTKAGRTDHFWFNNAYTFDFLFFWLQVETICLVIQSAKLAQPWIHYPCPDLWHINLDNTTETECYLLTRSHLKVMPLSATLWIIHARCGEKARRGPANFRGNP